MILENGKYIDPEFPNRSFFDLNIIQDTLAPLKIGIIDADLLDGGTRHPNLALLKISSFCKANGHNVRLVKSYTEIIPNNLFAEEPYQLLIMSKVFKFTKLPVAISEMVDNGMIWIGGTGFYELDGPQLPYIVEHSMPDYHLYDDYIYSLVDPKDPESKEKVEKRFDDYLNFSIGFTTRGCIRQCGFCVNRHLMGVKKASPVSEFYDPSRKRIYLWDDNIMAAPPKIFKEVFDELKATKKPFQFRQGMDIRLITDSKAKLLDGVKYYGDYIFAFDHYRMDIPKERKEVEQTIKGLGIWRRNCLKSTKLYVLVGYDGIDVSDIEGTFFRIEIIMRYGCLPYIMRFENWENSEPVIHAMYIQLARWCNQPNFFKKKSFRQYCIANQDYHLASGNHREEYCSSYKAMLDFEHAYPEVAARYFDLRWEDHKEYDVK